VTKANPYFVIAGQASWTIFHAIAPSKTAAPTAAAPVNPCRKRSPKRSPIRRRSGRGCVDGTALTRADTNFVLA
jgi:hypothetical protein